MAGVAGAQQAGKEALRATEGVVPDVDLQGAEKPVGEILESGEIPQLPQQVVPAKPAAAAAPQEALAEEGTQGGPASAIASSAIASSTMARAPQPAAHPGARLVLNMGNGMLSKEENPFDSLIDDSHLFTQQGGAVNEPQRPEQNVSTSELQQQEPFAEQAMPEGHDYGQAKPMSQERADEVGRSMTAVNNTLDRNRSVEGRAEVHREGAVTPPTPPKTLTRANRIFSKIRDIIFKDVKDNKLAGRKNTGMAFYETIFSKPDLMPHCVSIGTENILESLREPDSMLLQVINDHLAHDALEQPLTAEDCINNMWRVVEIVNRLNIEVVLDKSPVNVNHSVQVRTLRIHHGRGIGLHPTQVKAFNADYDGDPALLNCDQTQLSKYARAMDRLVAMDGTPMIDPDFFPLEPFDDKSEVADLLRARNLSWMPALADEMIDAYDAACNKGDWVTFLRKIDEVANKYSYGQGDRFRGEIASAILKSFYDFSIDRRVWSIRSQIDNMSAEHSDYAPPVPGTDPFVLDLCNMVDEIVSGRPCPSLVEFVQFYNRYYGDIVDSSGKAKNVPFRLLADFGKAINRTDLITIGSDLFGFKLEVSRNEDGTKVGRMVEDENASVSVFDLWQFTCVAALTKEISGRSTMGSRKLAVSTQVKRAMLRDVPLPEFDPQTGSPWKDVDDFRNWINMFRTAYNINQRMLHLAQSSFRGGMSLIKDEGMSFDGIGENYEKLAEALVRVYGQFTVGRIFGNLLGPMQEKYGKENTGNYIDVHYRNYSLERFSMDNRVVSRNVGGSKTLFSAIEERLKNGSFTPMDVLMLIADRRTAQLGRYDKEWKKATKELFPAVSDIYSYHGNQYAGDFNEYGSRIMNIVQTMSPDMFHHFGMDSPTTFAHSKWGKKLLSSETVDEFRTHLLSMMIEYRLGKASKILDSIDEAERDALSGVGSIARLESYDAAFDNEMEVLASSSMAWRTITSEMMNGNRVFKSLMKSNGATDGVQSNWTMYAKKSFWSRPAEEKEKYYSLVNFLKSSEPIDVKLAVLADVVKISENYANVSPSEMLGEIAYHPDRAHAGNRFDMDKGLKTEVDSLKESVSLLTSYMDKTPRKIREEADAVLREARKNPVVFAEFLTRLSNDPGYATYVDPMLAADAIASVFDKTYADTEKIKQQARVNGYFGCVSLQRCGGFYTHLYMTDNSVVNAVGYDQLTPMDIIRVLADPSIKMTVYDEFGSPAEISRGSLCGGTTIFDVINYLDKNPRIALACRRHVAGIASDVNGTARLNAMRKSNAIPYSFVDKVFSLLDDRPRFLATAALFTKSDGEVARNMPEKIAGTIRYMCGLVQTYANNIDTYSDGTFVNLEKLGADMMKEIGLSHDDLLTLRMSGRFDETDISEDDELAASRLFDEVKAELADCVLLVSKVCPNGSASVPKPEWLGTDKSSMIAYYDARQQISGARTAMMIGVEGAETKKNLVLKIFLHGRQDEYTMSESGQVIPLVEGLEQSSDMSFADDAHRVSSVAKFLEIKREAGAETYNAKYRKYGDDGTNSMIKFLRMAPRSVFDMYGKTGRPDDLDGTWSMEDADELLRDIHACSNKIDAVPILASALIEADIRLGYIKLDDNGRIVDPTFIESDYWNRASLMLGENSDGSLVIRTLEQISTALRTRISAEAVLSGDIEQVKSELEQIVYTLGTDMDPLANQDPTEVPTRCLTGVKINSSVGRVRIDRALSPRSSSEERNYTLLHLITASLRESMGMDAEVLPSQNNLKEETINCFRRLRRIVSDDVPDKLKGIAFPFDKYDEEIREYVEDLNGDRKYLYDFLGLYNDKDAKYSVVPGPQSIVLFCEAREAVADKSEVRKRLDECRRYGMTAAFTGDSLMSSSYLTEEEIQNLVRVSDDIWILPYFDMALNGLTSSAIMPAPTEIVINPNNAVVNVEDVYGEFKEGDSSYHITKELADRIMVRFRRAETISAEQLFPNALSYFGNDDYEIYLCSKEEVRKYIINGRFDPETLTVNGFGSAVIDIGLNKSHTDFDHEVKRFEMRLEEYKAAFGSADEDSILIGNCRYDSIVGFTKIVDKTTGAVVLAPIWPFRIEESGMTPTTFSVERFQIDRSTGSFILEWVYTGGIEGQYIKAFEGIGASTKMVTSGERARSRALENGIMVDGFYSTATIGSRLFPSNKRIATMISAMMMTRIDPQYSYNFANLADSFPGNPQITRQNGEVVDVKSALANGQLGLSDWKLIAEKNITYHPDRDINRIVKWWVDKCIEFGTVNPTTLLATKTENGVMWPKITEFEAFFDTGYIFQNSWMKLMHAMNPTLVPESIDGDSSKCLYKPVSRDDVSSDYGVLQMVVPYYDSDGKEHKALQNVYISMGFFGDEFSGFKKVNMNGKRRSIDNLNVANEVDGDDLKNLLTFAHATTSAVPSANSIEVIPNYKTFEAFPRYRGSTQPHGRELDRETYGKTLALTGHRPTKDKKTGKSKLWGWNMSDPHYKYVKQKLAEYCVEHDIDTIISGMALGFDQLGAEVALELGLNLVAAIPFENQDSEWPEKSKRHFHDLLSKAKLVVNVSGEEEYKRQYMQDRNEWMMNNADEVFALYDGSSGGTDNAVRYANRIEQPIHILTPQEVNEQIPTQKPATAPAQKRETKQNRPAKTIDSFRGEYSFLSNMYDFPFVYDGFEFRNAESAFQAQKLAYKRGGYSWYEMEPFENISGAEAKRLGRSIPIDKEWWDSERRRIMKDILKTKFSHEELFFKLLETGDAELIEGNSWGDTYWGVSGGKGQNNLGKILQEIRDEFRAEYKGEA